MRISTKGHMRIAAIAVVAGSVAYIIIAHLVKNSSLSFWLPWLIAITTGSKTRNDKT